MLLKSEEAITAYYQGYIDACCDYAIWNQGEQFIGVGQQPLKERILELRKAQTQLLVTRINEPS